MNIKNAHVLLVGAGGVGSELLKNLVLMDFDNIDVVDLDTIELSNLNRQFLFRQFHVGRSKAEVAVESVLHSKPSVKIQPFLLDITTCGIDFFEKYDLIFNALDNKQARFYVNRMCVALNIPLIESGTSGYFGQAVPILPQQTECYGCTPKPSTKSFPSCTIRNTPSEFIHCVVWAKALFNQIFGEMSHEDNEVSPEQSNDDSSAKVSLSQMAKNCEYNGQVIFKKVFDDDINILLSMTELWINRKPPQPIVITINDEDESDQDVIMHEMTVPTDIGKLANIFIKAVSQLKTHIPLQFDKDDDFSMDFVYASSNLRAVAFHIPLCSRFEVKSKAGNIIPAIASTNAIIAALAVHQGSQVLLDRSNKNIKSMYFKPNQITKPNTECFVCGGQQGFRLTLNPSKCNLSSLRNAILTKFACEDVDIILGDGRLLPDQIDNQILNTFKIGLAGGSILIIETDSDERMQILVNIDENLKEDDLIFDQIGGIKRKRASEI